MRDLSWEGVRTGHDNNFHFLRFALAAAVLLSHAFELLGQVDPLALILGAGHRLGATAVDGFFLISGCLITASWERKPRLRIFLNKRFWRIVPGFAVASLLSVLVVGPLAGNSRYWSEFSVGPTVWSIVTFGSPVTPSVFSGQLAPIVNGSMWTIRYELFCYAVVPILALTGLLGRRWIVLALTMLVVGGYLAQCPFRIIELGQGPPALRLLVPIPRLLGCFLIGSCYHLFAVRCTGIRGLVALAGLLVANRFGFTATQAGIVLGGGYLLFTVAQAPSRWLRAWNHWPDISYGLYLYAWPIQMLLIRWFPAIHPGGLFVASFALSGCAGAASWYGVERWFVRTRPLGSREQATMGRGRVGVATGS